ncbi:MAG: acyl-CoA synthetase FdrA [Burkholderiaceae bacterium]
MSQAITRFKRFANLYQDSVTLMQLGAALRERSGIEQASCLMATPANLSQLAHADLEIDATVSPSDLLVIVRGDAAACEAALLAAESRLLAAPSNHSGDRSAFKPPLTSIALGVAQRVAQGASADLALISVPGDYAAAEALKALALGLHVMLFSDNVSVADEVAIKTFARSKGLLVMGPDCGTAIVNGVPLGFANVVRRGDIGLVAASGTGLQEVTCRIHNLGGGVSQALGTGGRDLKEEIGGITMLQGLAALAADPTTRIIVLISKPPAPAIAREIERAASAAGKPVVVHFLGAKPGALPAGLVAATSLRHAADLAVALARGGAARVDSVIPANAGIHPVQNSLEQQAAAMAPSQHTVRALFTGGTFCYEAQGVFLERGLACSSNAPAHGAATIEAHGAMAGHVLLDLGDDDYTRGRPHPMIDPSLRDGLVREAGADASVAALLFDVVLGYGSHANPAAGLALALADAQHAARAQGRTLALIGHVCGTDGDPQDRAAQVRQLDNVGAMIVGSNVEAALLAAQLAAQLAQRSAADPPTRRA